MLKKDSVTTSTTYNAHVRVNEATRCKGDPLYLFENIAAKGRRPDNETNGLFTLHGNGTGTSTWNRTKTIGNNGS